MDPVSLNPDPDPAFQVNPDPDTDPIRIKGFDDQKLKKKIQMENLFDQKLQFTYVQATGEDFSPQKRTSSTSKMKFIYFFLCLWVIFALLDPDTDPGTALNPDTIWIRNHSSAKGPSGPVFLLVLEWKASRAEQISSVSEDKE